MLWLLLLIVIIALNWKLLLSTQQYKHTYATHGYLTLDTLYIFIHSWLILLQHILNAFERHGHFWQIDNLLYIPVMGLNRPAGVWYLLSCTTPSHAQPDPAEKLYFSIQLTFFRVHIEKNVQIQQYTLSVCPQTANAFHFFFIKQRKIIDIFRMALCCTDMYLIQVHVEIVNCLGIMWATKTIIKNALEPLTLPKTANVHRKNLTSKHCGYFSI